MFHRVCEHQGLLTLVGIFEMFVRRKFEVRMQKKISYEKNSASSDQSILAFPVATL